MASTSKSAWGFTLAIAGGLIAVHRVTQSSPDPTPEIKVEHTLKTPKPASFKRRQRTGPRTPPPNRDPVAEPAVEADQTPQETAEQSRPSQSERLREYMEHLEVLDNPTVDELTMLGEMAFEANQVDDAYDHYLEVIEEHTDDPNAVFALYKLAWTEYNLGDVEAAIDDMALVVEWTQNETSSIEQTIGGAAQSDLKLFRSELK